MIMGYDIDRFVNLSPEISENFKCSVCLDIFEAPLELPCGHIFCLECIRSCFDSSNTCECPECRHRVESREVKPPNRKLLCLLHSFKIKCEFANGGCCMVVKLENLIDHTRVCHFNTSRRSSAPPVELNFGDLETITDLLVGDSDFIDPLERLQRLQFILAAFSDMINENEVSNNESSQGRENEIEALIQDNDTSCKDILCCLISFTLIALPTAALVLIAVGAIFISALKLHSCAQIPTLPRALLALGISLLLSVILEITRRCCYANKFCIGLKFIQSFAFGSLIYLAILVYSNLGYTNDTSQSLKDNSTLTCNYLLFEFSFWSVSALLTLISIIIILSIMYAIYNYLTATWTEWEGSYVLLSFIYIISFSGIVISVSAMTMGSVYFESCSDIPSLTTKLVVFGTLGFVCCLIMLLYREFMDCVCFWLLVIGWIASFICVAVPVHNNFPLHASLHDINCNKTLCTYSLVIVCFNYVIIGSTILMWSIYGGVCACLFFK